MNSTDTPTMATTVTTLTPPGTTSFGVSMTTAFQNSSEAEPEPGLRLTGLDFWVLEIIWFFYCSMGKWSVHQPLRILALLAGCLRMGIENIYRGRMWITLSWFAMYLLGRIDLDTTRQGLAKGGTVTLWLGVDIAALFWGPLRLVSTVIEALGAVAVLAHIMVMTMALQQRQRGRWLHKIGAMVLWGLGWGATATIHLAGSESSVAIAMWLMMYAILFPEMGGPDSPSIDIPAPLGSPWMRSLTLLRSLEERGP